MLRHDALPPPLPRCTFEGQDKENSRFVGVSEKRASSSRTSMELSWVPYGDELLSPYRIAALESKTRVSVSAGAAIFQKEEFIDTRK